jgi:two-component sensor histidine kinase
VEDGALRLVWRESGGPPVIVPTKRGFGSRMIERGLAAELGGKVKIDFAPAGLICTVAAPLPRAGAA